MAMQIDSFTHADYFTNVNANSGENQITFGLSLSQCGKSPLIIVSMGVDGDSEVLMNRRWLSHDLLLPTIRHTLLEWCAKGIAPTKLETAANEKIIDKMLSELKQKLGL